MKKESYFKNKPKTRKLCPLCRQQLFRTKLSGRLWCRNCYEFIPDRHLEEVPLKRLHTAKKFIEG